MDDVTASAGGLWTTGVESSWLFGGGV